MYLDMYRQHKLPYLIHDLTIEEDFNFTNYSDYFGVTTKEEIKSKYVLKDIEDLDLREYNLVIHIPYTKDMVDNRNRLNFILNGEPLNVMDYYFLVVNEFMYIFLKNTITAVNSLELFSYKGNLRLHRFDAVPTNINVNFSDIFYSYHERNNDGTYKYKVEYKDSKVIILDKEHPSLIGLLRPYLNDGLRSIMKYLRSIEITSIKLFNKSEFKFVDNDNDKLYINDVLNIGLDTTKNIDDYQLIIFYRGPNINEFINSIHNKQIVSNNFEASMNLDYIMDKYLREGINLDHAIKELLKIYVTDNYFKGTNENLLMDHMLSFDIDVFDALTKDRYTVTRPIDNITFVDKTELSKVKAYVDINKEILDKKYNKFMKFTFINYGRLPFEIFYNYRKFTDTTFVEHFDRYTNVYIKTSVFTKYYNITPDDIQPNMIGIRFLPDGSTERFIENINYEYNGVMIPDKTIYYTKYKLMYDKGYPIDPELDMVYNTLPPYDVAVVFPQKKLLDHQINVVLLNEYIKPTLVSKRYIKFRNITTQEKDDYKTNKNLDLIVGNRLRFKEPILNMSTLIKIGNITLINGIDYILESRSCVKFLRIPVSPQDKGDTFTVEIFSTMDVLTKKDERRKSILCKITNSLEYINSYIDKDNVYFNYFYPDNYDNEISRCHQLVTKYFSTEMIIDLQDIDSYGEKWLNNLTNEFPDFVKTIGMGGEEIVDLSRDFTNTTIEDFPRIVSLPERIPLNVLITKHLLGIGYFEQYGYLNGEESYIDLRTLRKNKKLIHYFNNIDMDLVYNNFEYSVNIPVDLVFLK